MNATGPQKIPAERGLAWIREGGDLLYRQRRSMWVPALVLLALTFFSAIPILGLFVALLTPLVMAGILVGLDRLRDVGSDGQLPADAVFSIFSVPGAALRIIGMVILIGIGMMVVFILAFGFLGIDFSQINLAAGAVNPEELDFSGANWLAFFTVLLLGAVPLAALGYITMPRIALDRAGLLQALGSSARACVRNAPALAVFFLVLLFLILVFSVLVGVLALVVGIAVPMDLATSLFNVIMLPLQVLINLILLCAQYIMFRDMFPAPNDSDQSGPERGVVDVGREDSGSADETRQSEDQFRA